MIFDTHSHLDSEKFQDDFEEMIENIKKVGVSKVLVPGCDTKTSKKSVEISNKYDFVYSSVGFHPHEAKHMDETNEKIIEQLASNEKKVVAIGEIGLDYYYDFSPRDIQKEVFIRQIKLAERLNLPFIVHSRDASRDTYEILKEHKKNLDCVLHCYSQSIDMAKLYLDLGCYLSFAGPVTFKNAVGLQEVVKYVPIDRMFIETDSPYLSPEPKRGKRNESANVVYVGKKIADLRGMDENIFFKTTYNNAIQFFKLDKKFEVEKL